MKTVLKAMNQPKTQGRRQGATILYITSEGVWQTRALAQGGVSTARADPHHLCTGGRSSTLLLKENLPMLPWGNWGLDNTRLCSRFPVSRQCLWGWVFFEGEEGIIQGFFIRLWIICCHHSCRPRYEGRTKNCTYLSYPHVGHISFVF